MAHAACYSLTNSQVSGSPQKGLKGPLSRLRALFPLRCQLAQQLDPLQRDPDDAREPGLSREDALREAAVSLSLGAGVALIGREYHLIERLWRTDP